MKIITKTCIICNHSFDIEPYRKDKAKYCSAKCMGIGKRGVSINAGPKITKNCKVCGKEFEVIPSQYRVNHCSKKCGSITQSKKISGEKCHFWKNGSTFTKILCLQCEKESFLPSGNIKKGYGKFCNNECYGKWISENLVGTYSRHWRGGVTPENLSQRIKFRHELQKVIFERDRYTCQLCGKRKTKLHIDHIKKWSEYPELRFDLDNCRTLCVDCHYQITFGKPKPKNVKTWGYKLYKNKENIDICA